MYVRTKTFTNKDGSTRTYLYLVETVRSSGKVRQEIVANLGRIERLQEKGLDSIIEGLARYSKKQWICSQVKEPALSGSEARSWGPALVFRRLWEMLGLSDTMNKVSASSQITFSADEAAFAMVLHRLDDPGSKRELYRHWLKTVYRPAFDELQPQHFYRTLDLLAENKERIETALFEKARDLFTLDLDLVLWDTTSTYFEGNGPDEIGAFGLSKDHRPDRVQVMVGVLMTRDGYPVAHEVFPGNTADVNTFKTVLRSVLKRFSVRRCVIVGDRGMISKSTVRELEESGLEYILGLRMRRDKDGDRVLETRGRYRVVEENLHVKEASVDGKRYILCYNPDEAKRQKQTREHVVEKLKRQIQTGVKSLVKNRQYRRFLLIEDKERIGIDEEAVKREAKYDGKWILKTNTAMPAEEVAMAYKSLWQVERAFREMKSSLDLRPVYHWSESRVRGHIMVCFLALVLESGLLRALKKGRRETKKGENVAGGDESGISMKDLMADLKRLQAMKVNLDGKQYLLRTEFQGEAYEAFKVLGLRPPEKFQVLAEPVKQEVKEANTELV
jgi:transposase